MKNIFTVAVLTFGLALSACSSVIHQGVLLKDELTSQIKIGSSAEFVKSLMGTPSYIRDFGDETNHYYLSQLRESNVFGADEVIERTLLEVKFNKIPEVIDVVVRDVLGDGNFESASRVTDTEGRERSLIGDLFRSGPAGQPQQQP